MTLRLSPAILELAYEYLRATPPFTRWRLPDGDGIEFVIGRGRPEGEYTGGETSDHRIVIHETRVGHTASLMEVLAHEIVHVSLADTKHAKVDHGSEFKKRARLVCKYHGFDPKRFWM